MAYYAVKAGRKPGIYQTWDACRAQVHGYSGALYKKFDAKKDAEAYMDAEDSASVAPTKTSPRKGKRGFALFAGTHSRRRMPRLRGRLL